MSPSWPSNAMIGMKRLEVRAFYMDTWINVTKRNCVESQQTKRRCAMPELTLSVFMYFSRIALLWSASTRATSFLRFTMVPLYRSRRDRTIEIRTKTLSVRYGNQNNNYSDPKLFTFVSLPRSCVISCLRL